MSDLAVTEPQKRPGRTLTFPDREALDVAIVGGGPRGFHALERLDAHLSAHGDPARVRVDVFEPRGRIGSGPNYDTGLPHILRMNFATEHIDAWLPRAGRDTRARPSLIEWFDRHHPAWTEGGSFPPRALVGEYLETCADRTITNLRSRVRRLRHVRERVRAVEPSETGGRWRVRHGTEAGVYDHVLLTTGHASSRRDGFAARWDARIDHMVSNPYGAQELRATMQRACSGCDAPVVALRGFALTSIDAMLLLTEGCGGRFASLGSGRMCYTPSGDNPVRVVPFSRTGRSMLAKPDPRRVRAADDLEDVWEAGREAVAEAADVAHVASVVASSAGRALARSREGKSNWPMTLPIVTSRINALLKSRRDNAGHGLSELATSVAVATGRAPVDSHWAIGESWRKLYPAIVRWVGCGVDSPGEHRSFARLAHAMERVAFGPPVDTAVKLLALEGAEVLDPRFLSDPVLGASDGQLLLEHHGHRTCVHMLVDAVSPAPGVDESSALLGPLLADGLVRVVPGTHGLAVDKGGRPVDRTGTPLPGLAVAGRATEGRIVGLDTLSRTLHDQLDTWARRVAALSGAPRWRTVH